MTAARVATLARLARRRRIPVSELVRAALDAAFGGEEE
jgi:hypothetical protein